MARRSGKGAENARDLAHEVLLAAIERGVEDLSASERRAWLRGALRKRVAFEARTAARASRRESHWQLERDRPSAREARPWHFTPQLLAQLAPAVRVLAALASAELQPSEIRSALRLSDTAFRKRLSELRRALREARAAGIDLVTDAPAAYALGALRRELIASLKQRDGWAIASYDPDGHLLIFSIDRPHKRAVDGNSS